MDKASDRAFLAGREARLGVHGDEKMPDAPKRRLAGEELMEMLGMVRQYASQTAGEVEVRLQSVVRPMAPAEARTKNAETWPPMFEAYREQVESIMRSLEDINDTLKRLEF